MLNNQCRCCMLYIPPPLGRGEGVAIRNLQGRSNERTKGRFDVTKYQDDCNRYLLLSQAQARVVTGRQYIQFAN